MKDLSKPLFLVSQNIVIKDKILNYGGRETAVSRGHEPRKRDVISNLNQAWKFISCMTSSDGDESTANTARRDAFGVSAEWQRQNSPVKTTAERFFSLRPEATFEEIAAQLGCSRRNVEQTYSRAWVKCLHAAGRAGLVGDVGQCGFKAASDAEFSKSHKMLSKLQPLRLGVFTYLEALRGGDTKAERWEWLQYGIALTGTLTREEDYQDYVRFVLSGREESVIARRRFPGANEKQLIGRTLGLVSKWENAIWKTHRRILATVGDLDEPSTNNRKVA